MAFWGVEVKPGRPFTHESDGGNRRLHVSQASLGNGTGSNKSILQCNVGNKSPVWLCALFPNSSEVCQIHVEYQETEDVVFFVIGPRSVHLSGYYMDRGGNHIADNDSESYGEDIGDIDTDRSDHDGEEDDLEDSFINDSDPGAMSASPVSSDGVEEVKTKPVNRTDHYKHLRKTYQFSDSDDDSSSDHQAAGIGDARVDSEDLLPILSLRKKLSARVESDADLPSNNLASEEQPGGTIDGNQRSHLDELKCEMVDKCKQEKLHEADGVDDFFSVSILKWPKLEEKERKNNKVGNDVSLFKEVDEETACRGSPPKQIDLQKGEKRKRKRKVQVEENPSQEKCDNSSAVKEDGENQELKPTTLDGDLSSPAEHNKDTSFSICISLADQVVTENDQEGKKPKKRKIHEVGKPLNAGVSVSSKTEEDVPTNINDDAVKMKSSEEFGSQSVDENPEEGKKKKSKGQELGKRLNVETPVPSKGEDKQPANIAEGVAGTKLSHVQAFPGGLLVEELEPGKKKGKVASLGRKISVSYTGKWKSTGEVFNTNIDGRPLKFVLGGEGVMEAWNVGLNGMRAGETRQLTILAPSHLRSSSNREGKGGEEGEEDGGEVITTTIPPLPLDRDVDDKSEGGQKSWLVYDIKLLKVYKK